MMSTTRHQQLNSLVGQIRDDAHRIKQTAGCASWFSEDDLKNMTDAAKAITTKVETYRKLNASAGDDESQR